MIVVTGASGNVGRELVAALAAAGEPVTATSRRIAEADVPAGVRAVRADLTDAESLRPVFEGADAVFLQNGGASLHRLRPRDLVDAAKRGGVRRVVLLSSQGVATRPESPSHGQAVRVVEDAVRESGLEWTVLRPGGFHSNAYAWAESVRASRTVAAPFGDVGLPTVDPADIAEVAAVALRGDGHAGRVYELTGPEPTTPRQRAEAIGRALGEPVRFVEQSPEEARQQMLAFMPEPVVETTLAILGAPTPAERRVAPDVAQVLGRAPRGFAEWARRNVEAFR
ncbi:NAD(P)H-binding protein [Streptomyces griseosporeus]|uniref:NAD(P)H-binding protein n=1 Tax=Streptomyces griseosporeus TaxID=1910 RepID=UPI00167C948D|nr:NAD(P)H-binding protein [Streptomyces griseosporeus]GHF40969.1 NmrA family transcriptional regulator [Streptomyces griseosporeus]